MLKARLLSKESRNSSPFSRTQLLVKSTVSEILFIAISFFPQ